MTAIAQTMQGMGSVRVLTMVVVGVLLLGAFGFLSIRLTSPVLSPLFSGLSADDSGVIVTELGALGVDFEISGGGSEILVKSSEVLEVRMALAQKGLPRQGSIVGYEVFDKESALGTSNFVHNVNLLRALEGELGRTISSLSSIKSARVHLVIPRRNLFEKARVEPSASVVLSLNNRTRIPKEEATAVKHLVSSAVPGLKTSRVTIVDTSGLVLARGTNADEEGSVGGSSSNSEEYRASFEERLKNEIIFLLEQAVGVGRVQVQVSSELAFDRTTTNKEIYDPDGQVARSVQSSTATETSTDGSGSGDVSVANNLPNAGAESGASSNSSSTEKIDEITNFEISKTITSHVSEVGVVKKISVAVLVDGDYNVEENEDGEEIRTYIPRTDETIEQLRTLVKSAIGFNETRGDTVEIVNMQFQRYQDEFVQDEGALDWLKRDLDSILKTLVVGIVAILAILLVIRPLVNRAFEISPADLEAERAQAVAAEAEMMQHMDAGGGEEIDLDMIQSKVESTPARKVNDLIENNPEETLSVIRTWLSQ